MKKVYKLGTDIEFYYSEAISDITALKTSYALDSETGLATRLAIDHGEVMEYLEGKIQEGKCFLLLGDYTIKKAVSNA